MSRILFVMLHPGFIRYYDAALRALADEGHDVRLAFEVTRTKLGEDVTARMLSESSPRITCVTTAGRAESVRTFLARADRTAVRSGDAAPRRHGAEARAEAWESLATTVRLMQDHLRYFDPAFAQASALRARAAKRLPRVYRGLIGAAARIGSGARRLLATALSGFERLIPAPASVVAFLRAESPDLLLVTPLIELGSQQVDYVKASRQLGIRSALCVASWDNLTSKGLIRVQPDHVLVWNEAQRREAATLHGVTPDRVLVTGAQVFDKWFDAGPTQTRESFCRRVGLDPDRPYILYVGSSVFIAPDEVPFARRWLSHLRAAPDPQTAHAGVLVRPHPANDVQWHAFDTGSAENVAVWPPPGMDPNHASFRDDFFDSLYHSAAVVGINTSAQLEAAIIGRPVLTIHAEEFGHAQEGTLHFQHMVREDGGFVLASRTLEEHVRQLGDVLAAPDRTRAANERFVETFIRPRGRAVPAVPVFVGAVAGLAARPRPRAQPDSLPLRVCRGPGYLAAVLARLLAEDRPLWVYAARPFITAAVWTCAVGYRTHDTWRHAGRRGIKRGARAARQAWVERSRAVQQRVRRARKPLTALVRGAARRVRASR